MSYEHGRFVWFELLGKDLERAASFYPETLPWRIEPMKMQDGSEYKLIKAGDAGIGGFVTPNAELPTMWVSYVSVADVDETAKKIVSAGGSANKDAMDMPGVGRMQPVSDAQGGAFSLFKAETGDPPKVEGPGAFHWNELWTQDPKASLTFYSEIFGYTHDEFPMPNGTYYVLKDGDEARGGILKSPSPDIPTMWLQYVEVEDCDETLDRAQQNGATVVSGPMDAEGVGRFGVIHDPLGGVIGVIKPASA